MRTYYKSPSKKPAITYVEWFQPWPFVERSIDLDKQIGLLGSDGEVEFDGGWRLFAHENTSLSEYDYSESMLVTFENGDRAVTCMYNLFQYDRAQAAAILNHFKED